jgi:shikimate kinase
MEHMNACGETVFLEVDVDVLFRRLKVAKQQRPLLAQKTDEELKEFIVSALAGRKPYYSKAKHIFRADELEDRQQIQNSVNALKKQLNLI